MILKYIAYLNSTEKAELFINFIYVLFALLSFSRVNTFFESDSNWYALNTDRCLFGDKSFYDFLGYTSFVYYYPKFKELLMAPISALRGSGALISINIFIWILCILETFSFLKNRFIQACFVKLYVLLVFSTPCIYGIASTAKSDVISYLFSLILIYYFVNFLTTKNWTDLAICICSGLLTYCVKYTSFLFTTIILVILGISFLYKLIKREISLKSLKQNKMFFVLLIMTFIIFAGIMYRTIKLTGYPTYREGKEVWEHLGFTAQKYFNCDNKIKPGGTFAPERILNSFFLPDNSGKIAAQWIGNFYLFYLILLMWIKLPKNTKISGYNILKLLSIILGVLSVYLLVTMAAPDGNYFGIPIIIVSLYILWKVSICESDKILHCMIRVSVCVFILISFIYAFVTHPSWSTGTRFSSEQINFKLDDIAGHDLEKKAFSRMGVSLIEESLEDRYSDLFLVADYGSTEINRLNARIELSIYLFDRYVSGAYIDNYEDFVDYVNYIGVEGFIFTKDNIYNEDFVNFARRYLNENGWEEFIEDQKCTFFKIKN